MKKSDGMLVSREYLERLDAAVFGTKAERTPKESPVLHFWGEVALFSANDSANAWKKNDEGEWYAEGKIRRQSLQDEAAVAFYPFHVEGEKEQNSDYLQFWAVWRERWEMFVVKRKNPLKYARRCEYAGLLQTIKIKFGTGSTQRPNSIRIRHNSLSRYYAWAETGTNVPHGRINEIKELYATEWETMAGVGNE